MLFVRNLQRERNLVLNMATSREIPWEQGLNRNKYVKVFLYTYYTRISVNFNLLSWNDLTENWFNCWVFYKFNNYSIPFLHPFNKGLHRFNLQRTIWPINNTVDVIHDMSTWQKYTLASTEDLIDSVIFIKVDRVSLKLAESQYFSSY